MVDTVTRVTHQSYGSRIANSWKGMLAAPIFLIVGIWILVWNESNSVTQSKALKEGLKTVVDVVTIDSVDKNLEGSLIHFMGKATAGGSPLQDSALGVVAPEGTLKLKRNVEMYQWTESQHEETRKNVGGSTDTITTYSYRKEWQDHAVNSFGFEESATHENPNGMMFDEEVFEADSITVGAYELSSAITNKITWYRPLRTTLSKDANNTPTIDATIYGNSFYFGSNNPNNPSIGDTRVSFEEIPEQIISVVAKQMGNTLSSFTTSNGGSVLLVESGPHDAAEMFHHAHQALTMQTWLFRLLGFVILYIAFQSMLRPLSVIADFIPFIGNLLEVGNSCLSFFLSFALSTVVIALSWLAYRPLFSIVLFAGVGGAFYSVRHYKQRKRDATEVVHAYEIPNSQFIPEAQAYVIPESETQFKDTEVA